MIPILTPLQKLLIGIVAVLLIVGAFWLAMHFYGVHRYDEGVSAANAAWQKASDQLKSDASNASSNADANKAAADANFIQQHAADQNAVANAAANGTSPLEALFGN